jgi:hypothetical protein
MARRRRRRLALLALNPGKTRRIRIGKRRAFTVEIDRETRRILKAAGGGDIPQYWIGVPFKNVPKLERELRQAGRGLKACVKATKCREDRPDRLGRRRPCRETFKHKREAYAALDDALGGLLAQLLDHADDGSPELRDLAEHAGRGRRRGKLPSWGAALDWAAPSSRRWRDWDKNRLQLVSEHLGRTLERAGVPFPGLRLPRETDRLFDADAAARECDDVAGDMTARALREALAELVDLVPF